MFLSEKSLLFLISTKIAPSLLSFAVNCLCQILIIIRALYNGIIDHRRLIKANPCNRIFVFFQQSVKTTVKPFPSSSCRNGNVFNLIVLFPAGVIRNQHRDKLIQRKNKHARRYNKHSSGSKIKCCPFLFLFLF